MTVHKHCLALHCCECPHHTNDKPPGVYSDAGTDCVTIKETP